MFPGGRAGRTGNAGCRIRASLEGDSDMKKYVKPETELIKVDALYNLCAGSTSIDNGGADVSGGHACAPRYDSDDVDNTDVNSVW